MIAVLFSETSRAAYAVEAHARKETYTFTDAWGMPRTWLKNEYAYLAPNAARLLLSRCNLKHELIEEAALTEEKLAGTACAADPQCRSSGGTDHRAHRALARGGGSPPDRNRQDQPAATSAGPQIVLPRRGQGLHRLALAARLAFRQRRLGKALCQQLPQLHRAEGGADRRQPRARQPRRADRRSGKRFDGYRGRARTGHRRHRQDALRRQPGLRVDRRNDAGPSQCRAGPAFHQRGALGRHAALLLAAADARSRAGRLVADAAALVRYL